MIKTKYLIGYIFFLLAYVDFPVRAQNQIAIDSIKFYYDHNSYTIALEFWEVIEEDCKDSELVKIAGNCYLHLLDYEKALEQYNIAELYLKDKDYESKYLLLINFSIAYRSLNRYSEASDALAEASRLNKQHGPFDLSNYLYSLGQYYDAVNEPDSAEKYLIQALNEYIASYGRENEHLVRLYSYLTTFYQTRQEYNRSIYFGKLGLQAANEIDPFNQYSFSFNYIIGISYYELKNWHQATYFYTKALIHISENNLSYQPFIESALAYCYSNIDDKLSDSLFRIGYQNYSHLDTSAYAYHLICYGTHLANKKNRPKKAHECYQKAFELLRIKYGRFHYDLHNIYHILGIAFYKDHQYNSSLYYYQRALYSRFPEVDTVDYSSNPFDLQQADLWLLNLIGSKLETLAMVIQQDIPHDSAIIINHHILANSNYYIHCLNMLLQDKIFLADQVNILSDNIRRHMLTGINACHMLYTYTDDPYFFEKGLEFSETGKYLLLKSMMDEKAQKQLLPEKIIQADATLGRQINMLHMQISRNQIQTEDGNEKLVDSLNNQLFSLILRKDSLRNVILTQHPDVKQHETHQLSIGEISQQLFSNQTLIEFFIQDSVLHAFYISKSGVEWKQMSVEKELMNSIQNIVTFCNMKDYVSVSKSQYVTDASYLSKTLLGPADSINPMSQQYIIIPDGELIFMPFGILLSGEVNENMAFVDMPYLFRDHTISYYYSLRFLLSGLSPQSDSLSGLLAVAPAFMGDTSQPLRGDLYAIEEATYEAGKLCDLLDGKLLSGEDASKENVFRFAPNKDILHFASHTVLNPDNAFDSYILLSFDQKKNEPQRLYTSEICCMDLNAQMAVLSSCNTGSGQSLEGEGVISLAWAFHYAGCESVVMSLFQLDDVCANRIMTSFYGYLKRGKAKDMALKLAKLDFLDEMVPSKTHPRFWAGFIISGEHHALNLQKPIKNNLIYLALCLAILLVLIMFARKQYLRKIKHQTLYKY